MVATAVEVEAKKKAAAEDYIPVDFESYSIPDREAVEKNHDKAEALTSDEKLWRISSLTTFVDNDTRILLLPIPESKRSVKIQDTKYIYQNYGDLLQKHEEL